MEIKRAHLKKKKKRGTPINYNKAIIESAYKLNENEISELIKKFPLMVNKEIENKIDTSLFAGVIINVGTKRLDLSLNGGLQNLKNYIYERS